jgi:hypothetical protein
MLVLFGTLNLLAGAVFFVMWPEMLIWLPSTLLGSFYIVKLLFEQPERRRDENY